MLIVLTTCPERAEAESLARGLVKARLAACVQILPQITSIYYWEEGIQEEPEYLLLIKTIPDKWEELEQHILKEHSYSVPEIVAIESSRVSAPYAAWLSSYLSGE